MRTTLKILLISLFFLSFFAKPLSAQAPSPTTPVTLSPKAYVALYATVYGANADELSTVINCESGFDPNVKPGDHGLAHNVTQYHKDTFLDHAKLLGETLDYDSYQDHIKLMAFIFAKYPKYKRAWSTWDVWYGKGLHKCTLIGYNA